MRGTLRFLPLFVSLVGIIPADAGSTVGFPLEKVKDGDHPRGCGEHILGFDYGNGR